MPEDDAFQFSRYRAMAKQSNAQCLTLKLKVKQIEDLAETDRQTSINMHKADKNDASRSSRLFPVRSE